MRKPLKRADFLLLLVLCTSPCGWAQQAASTPVARGKYLVENVGLCADCHTARNDKGEWDRAHWLQGAVLGFQPVPRVPDWSAVAPPIAGLPGWTDTEAIKFFVTGVGRLGKPARPPMPPLRLSRDDATAVVAYLKSLAPDAK